jgi:CelD/BcsL family acetyltransferase involved in cellulose biosynthesis
MQIAEPIWVNRAALTVMMNAVAAQNVVCLKNLEDMAKLESQWRQLDQASTADFVWFQSFEWCFRWMKHHGSSNCEPYVLMLMEQGEAVAILPLMRQGKRFGVTTLRILGEPHTQYANVLTRDGALTTEQQELLFSALQSAAEIDQLSLPLVPDNSSRLSPTLRRSSTCAATRMPPHMKQSLARSPRVICDVRSISFSNRAN